MATSPFRQRVRLALAEFIQLDLRRSYLVIAGMVVVGVIINLIFAHGWTVWPFVGAAGMLLMVSDAAERNGQGIPPIRVYALFAAALTAWIVIVTVMAALNPLIVMLGIIAMAYYAARAYIRQRERDRTIADRRENRLCIYCGEPADPKVTFCENCGEEPNPEVARMQRVAAIARDPASIARTRAMLTPAPPTTETAAKEAALLARRPRHGQPAKRGRS